MDADPVELVRSGYNAISRAYRDDDDPAHQYDPWLAGLEERIPGRARVLDAGTYRAWLRQAGLEVTSQQFVPEGDSGHALFWARRKPGGAPGIAAGER